MSLSLVRRDGGVALASDRLRRRGGVRDGDLDLERSRDTDLDLDRDRETDLPRVFTGLLSFCSK